MRDFSPLKQLAALAVVVVAVLSYIGFAVGSANANHIFATYGDRGYHWLARWSDRAVLDVSSDRCSARETDAYTRIKNSTTNASYMSDRWPSGLLLRQARCDGAMTNVIDIRLQYLSDFATSHGNYGGENHNTLAPSSYCASYSAPYPCGTHPATVHLNLSRFTSSSYSNAYRERLIMHETGHSIGLAHHCTSDAIMNDGTSSCNGGRWTAVMTYQATDRSGVRNIYPAWRYP